MGLDHSLPNLNCMEQQVLLFCFCFCFKGNGPLCLLALWLMPLGRALGPGP